LATNLALDPKLIEEAQRLGRHRTKKAAVTAALEEYIHHIRQLRVIGRFGTIDFDRAYDYKAARRAR
jgi:hypothetical protein